MNAANPAMIAIDWGTTNCRASLLCADGVTLDTRRSNQGAGTLDSTAFPDVMAEMTAEWPALPVWICGMAGSRQGWQEAPYLPCPADLQALANAAIIVDERQGQPVRIVPGLLYREANNIADIMRGEETQIAGYLAGNSDFEGIVIMPGTHSKWVRVAGGRVARFQTFLTGELYALLSKASILRHSVSAHASDIAADDPAFQDGLKTGLSADDALLANLFQIRTHDVLNGVSKDAASAKLSGLMIGAEFAAARQAGWFTVDESVVVIGGQGLSQLYEASATACGLMPSIFIGTDASTGGLWHLANQMEHSA